jgi:hypothetical protein
MWGKLYLGFIRHFHKIAKNDYELRHVRLAACLSFPLSAFVEKLRSHKTDFYDI